MASTIANIETLACDAGWRNYYFAKVTTNDGVVGWSEYDEGFGNPGIGYVIDQLKPRIVGRSVMQHERLHHELVSATRPASGGVVGQALGAIENALLDAKAKTLGIPCYELLGGRMRDRVPVYWSHCATWRISRQPHYQPAINDRDGVKALAAEVRDRGFKALKTNIYRYENGKPVGFATGWGIPFQPELNVTPNVIDGLVEHIALLREGAGPGVEIMVDLNFNAKTEGYLRMLRALDEFDLLWVELDSFNPKALAYVRSQSRHAIASCETLMGLQEFLPYFDAQAMDVAIVDLPWNGAWQSLKIATAAAAHEVNVAPHNFYGHLATMMNAHFASAIPNLRIMETDIDRIAWDDEIVTHAPEFEAGHLLIPDRPGWGTEPNEAALKGHPPNPYAHRAGLITYGRKQP